MRHHDVIRARRCSMATTRRGDARSLCHVTDATGNELPGAASTPEDRHASSLPCARPARRPAGAGAAPRPGRWRVAGRRATRLEHARHGDPRRRWARRARAPAVPERGTAPRNGRGSGSDGAGVAAQRRLPTRLGHLRRRRVPQLRRHVPPHSLSILRLRRWRLRRHPLATGDVSPPRWGAARHRNRGRRSALRRLRSLRSERSPLLSLRRAARPLRRRTHAAGPGRQSAPGRFRQPGPAQHQ